MDRRSIWSGTPFTIAVDVGIFALQAFKVALGEATIGTWCWGLLFAYFVINDWRHIEWRER